jgi:hypothetical protein
LEASELTDGDRGCERTWGDMGEYGMEMPLPAENWRVLEKVEPVFELV